MRAQIVFGVKETHGIMTFWNLSFAKGHEAMGILSALLSAY